MTFAEESDKMNRCTLKEIAEESIKKQQDKRDAFIFRNPDTQKNIAVARNLTELLIHLGEIDDISLNYHLYRTTKLDLEGKIDDEVEAHPRSDIALWIQYILGDDELAAKIWELRELVNDESLRAELIQVVKARHSELMNVLVKQKL